MSTFTHESMINHHGQGLFSQVIETLHVWRQRYQSRRELTQWSDRDLHPKPKNRSGGLDSSQCRRRLLRGAPAFLFGTNGSVP